VDGQSFYSKRVLRDIEQDTVDLHADKVQGLTVKNQVGLEGQVSPAQYRQLSFYLGQFCVKIEL
jgi:hypothetical protein